MTQAPQGKHLEDNLEDKKMFGALYAAEGSSFQTLKEVAQDFSPRIEVEGTEGREITLDLSGMSRLCGEAKTIAAELRRTAADRGVRVRVAIAGTRTAARLLVHARPGLTVIAAGTEAAALASLPLEGLAIVASPSNISVGAGAEAPRKVQSRKIQPQKLQPRKIYAGRKSNIPHDPRSGIATVSGGIATVSGGIATVSSGIATLKRWGLRTLGDVASLPADEVAARLGRWGVAWQRLACGEDLRPLVPEVPEERFEQAMELEWPIEGLEPLSFVLGRLMEPLSASLERRDRGAAVLRVRLHLVTRDMHERALQLAAPIRDARTLRMLALLDLESHPPPAAIDRVVVAVDPTPGRALQFSLVTRPLPSPECVSTLLARLTALMGEGRVGSPVEVETWQPGAFGMKPFAPDSRSGQGSLGPRTPVPVVGFRCERVPVPVRVWIEDNRPIRVATDRGGLSAGLRGGRVEICAGPWRTSGGWWTRTDDDASTRRTHEWDRDEWDVTLSDGATYRLYCEHQRNAWFIEGTID